MLIRGEAHAYIPPHAPRLGNHPATRQILKMAVFSLTYVGNCSLPPDALVGNIESIKEMSTSRGGMSDISGCVIFSLGRFAAVLEGDESAIETMMEHVRRDPQHQGATALCRRAYDARIFPGWSLAYAGRSLFVASLIDRASRGAEADVARLTQAIEEFAAEARA